MTPLRATLVVLALCGALAAQQPPAASDRDAVLAEFRGLLAENAYPLALAGDKLSGPGADQLLDAGRRSQFFVLAEEHNTRTLPRLATSLLAALQPDGYHYIATESATAHARWASEPPQRGHRQAIFRFAHRYPFAMTFYRDAEAQMFADAGRISRGKGRPVWGIDQEFGAEAPLARIVQAAPSAEARAFAEELRRRAHAAEADRSTLSDDTHFIAALLQPEELQKLKRLYRGAHDPEARWLIDDLAASNQIYGLYRQRRGYRNSLLREEYMKRVFMEEYRRAERLDRAAPKVILKAGHWHALRGQNPNRVWTTGNMLSELALSRGSRAFVLSTYIYEPGNYMSQREELAPFLAVARPSGMVVVLFEPLREKVWRKRFLEALPPKLVDLLFQADAALIMGGEKWSGAEELDAAK